MSSVDNRIVQMQFENSQFEKGVKQSLKSIEELEKSLEFKDAEKGLFALQKAGDSFSLANMAKGIEKINEKFSLMGIVGRRVIENLTDSAVRMGENFVKSITTDQIGSGWSKYAQKTEAVQTIIAATGKDIDYVEAQLEKLNWFTDETSYNFVDMTSNIGKFTSMGIDLETSVTAMQGIATWAAVSGQNAATASRAMYNMSQAIGVGSVKLMDWKSIENANMATKEFKQTAIETAKALGKLNAQGKTAKGTAVTFENFSQTLAEGWFTKDVLLKTLDKYGEYANKVYEISIEKGIPASQAMELITDDTMKLGEKAFKAAQEAKTFADAIDSVKDAVSTGWMNIFQDLFGNYEEAKVLWTDLANYLWDMFAAPLSDTHELLAEWNKLGGRTELLKGIYDIFEGIANIVETVKDAIAEVIPPTTVENLMDLSHAVSEFGENFKNTFSRTEQVEGITYKKIVDPVKELIEEGNFALGQTGDNVKELQLELVKLNLLEEKYVNGIYNPATKKAVDDFLSGIRATDKTLEQSFKIGQKGKEIEEFQKKLKELGFDPGGIDGVWGKKSQKAYDAYIASLGKTEKAYKELRKGMRGEDVKELQQTLIEAGFLDKGQADGIFGPKTEAALKKYQKAKRITASGIVDEKTFASLFPKSEEAEDEYEQEYTYVTQYSAALERLKRIVSGASAALHILGSFFSFLAKVIGHVGELLMPLANAFLEIGAAIGDSIVEFDKWLQETGVFDQWFENIKKFLEPFGQWVEVAAYSLLRFFGLTDEASESADEMMTLPKLYEKIKSAIEKTGIIEKVTNAWNKLKAVFDKIIPVLKNTWKTIKSFIGSKLKTFLGSLPDILSSVTEWLGNLASKGLEKVSEWIKKIPGAIEKIKSFWASLTQKGDPASGKAPGFLAKVKEGFKSVIDYLFGEGDVANGKRPGLFRRIGRLLSGDLDGFTEGMDENTKTIVLEKIQGIKDFIQKVREAIIVLFGGELSDDKKISDETIEKIKKFKESIASVFEGIALLFTGKVRKNSKLAKETQDKIIGVRNTIKGIIELIGNTLKDLWNTIVGIFTGKVTFESVGDFFTSFWDSIKEFFSQAFGIASTNMGKTWDNVSKFFSDLWVNLKNIGKWLLIGSVIFMVLRFIMNITGLLGKLKEVIASFRHKAQPLSISILEFAGAIALIAGSIWLIGQLDEKQFERGVSAVGGIVAAIFLFMGLCALLGRSKGAIKAIKSFGKAIFEMGLGIAVIAGTIVFLGALVPWDVLIIGLGKLAAIMFVLGAFIYALGTFKSTNIKLKGFAQIAIVLAVMAGIAYLLGTVEDQGKVWRGIAALMGIMVVLIAFTAAVGLLSKGKLELKGLIGLSIAIGIIALIAYMLGNVKDQGKVWRGIGAVAAIMAMIIGLAAVMGTVGKNIRTGTLITLFVGVIALMVVFGLIIERIKDVDPAVLYAFSLSLILALGAFVAACLIVGKIKEGPESLIKGATAIAAAFDILVILIGGLLVGIGAINEGTSGGLENDINSAAKVLTAIGNALTGFSASLNLSGEELIALFAVMELIGLMPGGALAMIAGSAAMAGAFDIFVILIGGLLVGIGAINEGTSGGLENDINSAAGVLTAIGNALTGFTASLNLSGDDLTALLAVMELIGLMPGGALAAIAGSAAIAGAFDTFVLVLGGFVAGIGAIDSAMDGGLVDAINHGGDVLESVSTAIARFQSGFNKVYNEDLAGFAEAVGAVRANTEGMSDDENLDPDIQKALEVAQKVHDFFDDLTSYTINTNAVNGYFTAAAQISTDMGLFGQAIDDFRTGVSGLSDEKTIDDDTDKAIRIATKIKESFFDVIAAQAPNGQGLLEYNAAISSVVGNVKEFATTMGTYHTNIAGFNSPGIEDDTGAAITAATAVADFLVKLKEQSTKIENNKSAIDAFFTGDTTQKTVFDAIESLGISVQSARKNLKGIGGGTFQADLEAAMTALSKIVGILAYLNENGITNIYTTGDFDNILALFDNVADKIVEFNTKLIENNVSESTTSSISAIMESVGNLANVLSGTGENGLSVDNFLSGLDLENVTIKLSEFSTYLGSAINGVVTDITGYVDTFTSIGLDLATSFFGGLSSGDPTNDVSTLMSATVSAFDGYDKSFETIGQNFTNGLVSGIASNRKLAVQAAYNVGRAMVAAAAKAIQSASPSKETMKLGNYFTEGLAIGTSDKVGEATNAASEVADSMLTTASGTLSTLSSLLADDIDVNPVIAPVVDLTNARQSAAMIGGLFGNPSMSVTSSVLAKDAMVSTNNGRPITIQNGTMSTSESFDGVSDQLNALTQYLTARNDGPKVDEISYLSEKFGDLAEAVTNLKIVLDTGALVGELTPALDTGFGTLANRRDRGN